MKRQQRKFRGARFTSKRDRKQRARKEISSNNYFDRAPSLASFHRGQVLHARVYFDDDPGTHKVRPVIFLREADRQVAEVLPAYSSRHSTRARSVQVRIAKRDCYLSLKPIRVGRVDLITSTREILPIPSQVQDEGSKKWRTPVGSTSGNPL